MKSSACWCATQAENCQRRMLPAPASLILEKNQASRTLELIPIPNHISCCRGSWKKKKKSKNFILGLCPYLLVCTGHWLNSTCVLFLSIEIGVLVSEAVQAFSSWGLRLYSDEQNETFHRIHISVDFALISWMHSLHFLHSFVLNTVDTEIVPLKWPIIVCLFLNYTNPCTLTEEGSICIIIRQLKK